MKLVSFAQVADKTLARLLEAFQRNVRDSLDQFAERRRPQTHGEMTVEVSLLSTSTVKVPHHLNRAYRGWYVVDQTVASVIWRDTTVTTDTDKFLPLKCSVSVTVKLVVF